MTQLANNPQFLARVSENLALLILQDELPKAIEKLIRLELDEKEQEKIQANFLARNDKHIARYQKALTGLIRKMGQEVLANIRRAPKSRRIENWLFSKSRWQKIIKAESIKQGKEPIIESGQYILDRLAGRKGIKQPPDIPDKFAWTDDVEAWLIENGEALAGTAIGTMYDDIAKELAEAIEAGESIPKIRDRIRDKFDDMAKWKAEQLARTEVLKASNKGWLEGARQSGVVEGKQWLAYVDQRCCPECASMDGVTMALDKGFSMKGEELFDYTGDALQHPPLHPDCRCTLIAIIREL